MGDFTKGVNSTEKPAYVASHDSATGMLLALSNFLKGKTFEGVGAVPSNEAYATFVNSLPVSWRKKLYTWSGEFPAIPQKKVEGIDASEIDRWVCDLYPGKKYPAIAIGSCNGAAIHLCAALGIPWLPQTVLIPVDKGKSFPVDKPKKTMEWAMEPVKEFLKRNEDWEMHHMMDPNQDRLRVGKVAYFRIKKSGLGKFYKKFLEEWLEPGGKIIVIDCKFRWPVHKISDRHYFQFGGLGGLAPEEYYFGSKKVRDFLHKAGSDVEQWNSPRPNTEAPEAEWGLASALKEDIKSYAEEGNIPAVSISFDHPQDLSAPVADLFRWWYRQQDCPSDNLLVETFNLVSPYLGLKKRLVPYWLAFIANDSAAELEAYLDKSKTFEEIYMMVLSHGKDSAGRTSIARWKELMQRAAKESDFIGTDPKEYPVDMAVYARYSKDLEEKIDEDYSFPPHLDVEKAFKQLRNFSGNRIEIEELH